MYWFPQRKLGSFFFLLRLMLGFLWLLSQGQCELLLELQEAGHFLLDGCLVCLGRLELPHLVSLLERVFSSLPVIALAPWILITSVTCTILYGPESPITRLVRV